MPMHKAVEQYLPRLRTVTDAISRALVHQAPKSRPYRVPIGEPVPEMPLA
jgi:hypothetical protein